MGMLITATILDSYDWMISAPPSWKDSAKQDFIDCVNRAKRFKPTPEQQRGMDFEKLICENRDKDVETFADTIDGTYTALGASPAERNKAVEIALEMREAIGDGRFQEKLTLDLHREAQNETWTMFGCADVFVPEQGILDIKTCTSFKDERKYTNKNQHHVYRLCSGLTGFYYLVADFDNSPFPRALHVIDASGTVDESRNKVISTIERMQTWLQNHNLWDSYIKYFCRGRV